MAETIYVAIDGDDNTARGGSIDYPFKKFSTALYAVSAYDTTVILRDGTYPLHRDDGEFGSMTYSWQPSTGAEAPGYWEVVSSGTYGMRSDPPCLLGQVTSDDDNSVGGPAYRTSHASATALGMEINLAHGMVRGETATGNALGQPRTINIPWPNVTIKAENQEKAIIDCGGSQPGIHFLTRWSGSQGSTYVPNKAHIEGLVIKNFVKKSFKSNDNGGFDQNGGIGTGLFNVSHGWKDTTSGNGGGNSPGPYGLNSVMEIKMHKCVIQDCIIQNTYQSNCLGLLGALHQGESTHRAVECVASGGVYQAPARSSGYVNGCRFTYSNCLFNNIYTDEDDPIPGRYGFAGLKNVEMPNDYHVSGNYYTVQNPMSSNILNCTFYLKGKGASQFQYFLQLSGQDAIQNRTVLNIQNNIFYNVGQPFVWSADSSNFDFSETPRGPNIFKNNCLYNITSGGNMPTALGMSPLSGNLEDTNPQILAPDSNRWGLRQNSPCVNTGAINPTEL